MAASATKPEVCSTQHPSYIRMMMIMVMMIIRKKGMIGLDLHATTPPEATSATSLQSHILSPRNIHPTPTTRPILVGHDRMNVWKRRPLNLECQVQSSTPRRGQVSLPCTRSLVVAAPP